MVAIGNYNELKIRKEVEFGVYLDSDAGDILLPKKHVPKGARQGDAVRVFLYKDSEGRLIATTLTPKATVGEFAYLKVVAVTRAGAFLDWGIEKDLLVPYSEQREKVEVGKRYIVRVFFDEARGTIAASTKIGRFIENEHIELEEGQAVELLVYSFTDLGIKVIVENKYFGMLYRREVFQELSIGDRIKGVVKRIRDDGKIDVMLRKGGMEDVEDAKAEIVLALKEHNRFLPLTDDSDPEVIRDALHMSKKLFKKAVGGLYKDGLIELKRDGILLKRPDKAKILHRFKF
jgi:predicted RNA-binding protein (virulence factor B family)